MSFIKIWIHAVWATKNREQLLSRELRKKLFDHIRANAKEKNIYIDCINGYDDHVHCLLSLNADQPISKTIQLIKGESSFWINKNQLCRSNFEWQDDYFAASVSDSDLGRIRNYIRNQEQHHQNKTFIQEWEQLMIRYKMRWRRLLDSPP